MLSELPTNMFLFYFRCFVFQEDTISVSGLVDNNHLQRGLSVPRFPGTVARMTIASVDYPQVFNSKLVLCIDNKLFIGFIFPTLQLRIPELGRYVITTDKTIVINYSCLKNAVNRYVIGSELDSSKF